MTEGRSYGPDDGGSGSADGVHRAPNTTEAGGTTGTDDTDDTDDTDSGGERRFERLEEPRADRTREWELFVGESSEEPLRHVGSVSAPTAETAREQATTLFGFAAETLWLCPADETVRLVADDVALGDRATECEGDDDGAGAVDGGAEP